MQVAKQDFDVDMFHDYVVAHGFGAPTEEGVEKGKKLMCEGDDYATVAFEIVALQLTTELQ